MTRLLLDKTKQTEEVDYRPISHNNCRTPSNLVDLSISFFDTATEAQSVIASYFLVHQKGTHQHQLSWHEERIAAVTLKHPPSLFLRTAHVHVVTATAFPAYLSLPPSDTRIRRTYKMPSTFIGIPSVPSNLNHLINYVAESPVVCVLPHDDAQMIYHLLEHHETIPISEKPHPAESQGRWAV